MYFILLSVESGHLIFFKDFSLLAKHFILHDLYLLLIKWVF